MHQIEFREIPSYPQQPHAGVDGEKRHAALIKRLGERQRQKIGVLEQIDAAIQAAPDEAFIEAAGHFYLRMLETAFKKTVSTENDRRLLARFTSVYPGTVVRAVMNDQEREALLCDLRGAILSAYADHVIIEVPDGGSYRLIRERKSLRKFRVVIEERLMGDRPKRVHGVRVKSRFKQPLVGEVTPGNVKLAAAVAAETYRKVVRGPFGHVVQDGAFTVATDNSRICVLLDGDGEPIDQVVDFPKDWRRAMKGFVDMQATGFSFSSSACFVGAAETSSLAREAIRLKQIFEDPSAGEGELANLHAVGDDLLVSGKTRSGDMIYLPEPLSETSPVICRVALRDIIAATQAAMRLGVPEIRVFLDPDRPHRLAFVFSDRGFLMAQATASRESDSPAC